MSIPHGVCYAVGFVVFVAATITDYYDGKIARERNLVTNFGKLLDPVADKVLLSAGFVMLMTLDKHLALPGWAVIVILAREFLVTGARSLAASEGVVIAANKYGKTKAALQMTYVIAFLFFVILGQGLASFAVVWAPYYQKVVHEASYWAGILVAVYTVYSGVQFARINWGVLSLDTSL